ncbi:hypothetical protein PUN28_005765 [Cardiocondyla obscurior]|uniref:Uncharacterized protein n=1 Tax=Cardiocondyla obscurior TaxID=286306 RepID=A0AAW2G761_9HYME
MSALGYNKLLKFRTQKRAPPFSLPVIFPVISHFVFLRVCNPHSNYLTFGSALNALFCERHCRRRETLLPRSYMLISTRWDNW